MNKYNLKEIKTASDALGFASVAAFAVSLNIGYGSVIRYSEGHEIRQPERVRLEEAVQYGLEKAEVVR